MVIRESDLPRWVVVENSRGSCDIHDEWGNQMFGRLSRRDATLIASAPALLRFLARFRDNAPIAVDLKMVLSRCGIFLEPAVREPLADLRSALPDGPPQTRYCSRHDQPSGDCLECRIGVSARFFPPARPVPEYHRRFVRKLWARECRRK